MSGNTVVIINLSLLYYFYSIHFFNEIIWFIASSGTFGFAGYGAHTAQHMPTCFLK